MIDEPTEGRAPRRVTLVSGPLERIAERDVAILLVEEKLTTRSGSADTCTS
jgi:ABC-type branched-subunit amino acid transport system ATPase component